MKFDNISIPYANVRTFTLWKMPHKTNWTGMIGLVIDDSNSTGYLNQISYTVSPSALPPSFDNQNGPLTQWNELLAGNIQLPAQNGTGSDDWYFLFSQVPNPVWSGYLNIGFYIIEMQTIAENETSAPISLYTGQEFLFKVST